ncbi:hypothetical protein BKA62DRAFT_364364 [Auriculariales sp. MPI-PUGE-AT-0066]|nr:hypothetical protein BKA62DRAFT_364364 [Auriculariales sp. MPI-PUGE-AT-0066]
MAPHLPADIMHEILSFSDRVSLSRFSQTCRDNHCSLTPKLYRTVTLETWEAAKTFSYIARSYHPAGTDTPRSTSGVWGTFSSFRRTRRSEHQSPLRFVRNLCIFVARTQFNPTERHEQLALIKLVQDTLKGCPHLFNLSLDREMDSNAVADMLVSTRAPRYQGQCPSGLSYNRYNIPNLTHIFLDARLGLFQGGLPGNYPNVTHVALRYEVGYRVNGLMSAASNILKLPGLQRLVIILLSRDAKGERMRQLRATLIDIGDPRVYVARDHRLSVLAAGWTERWRMLIESEDLVWTSGEQVCKE